MDPDRELFRWSNGDRRKNIGGEDEMVKRADISFKESCVKYSQEWSQRGIKKGDIISQV